MYKVEILECSALFRKNELQGARNLYKEEFIDHISEEDVLFDYGKICKQFELFDDSILFYKKIVSATNSDKKHLAYHALGNIYRELNLLEEAIKSYLKAIELKPDYKASYTRLGNAYRGIGDNITGIAYYKKGLEVKMDPLLYGRMLLAMHYETKFSANDIYREHQRYNKHFFKEKKYDYSGYDISKDRKIKIGFVSGDMRLHSISYFLIPILESLDKNKFDIYCYSNNANQDSTTSYIASLSKKFSLIAGIANEKSFNIVKNDNIDILIDLSGHTPRNNLALLAMKPAPIQISYCGYPDTTGLPAMDYRIVDSYTDPKGYENYATEKLLRMPNSFLCFSSLDKEGLFPNKKTAYDKNGYITFGSFNDITKLNRDVISAWTKILNSLPDARLLVKTKGLDTQSLRDRILATFRECKITNISRITLVGRINSRTSHLSLYDEIDIGLDTFPYNGTTTTFQALSMGVPVVTVIGGTHHSRVGYSIVKNIGHEELAAKNITEYVDLAVKLSKDVKKVEYFKLNLRRIMNDTLSNQSFFIKDFESMLIGVWERLLSKLDNKLPENVVRLSAMGDLILARKMHEIYKEKSVKEILNRTYDVLQSADVNLANLETVISEVGEMHAKSESNPYYYRANSNLGRFLVESKINVVNTANNHAMDFGEEALLYQKDFLNDLNVLSVGSGKNLGYAKEPVFLTVKDTIISIVSFSVVHPKGQSATVDKAGIFQISDVSDIGEALKDTIIDCRSKCDILIVTPHLLENWVVEPSDIIRNEMRKLIDLGVDGIFGHSSHILNGIEIYRNKPIVYDMGTFLVDTIAGHKDIKYSAIFQVLIQKKSISKIIVMPIELGNGSVDFCSDAASNEYIIARLTALKGNNVEKLSSYRKGSNFIISFDREKKSTKLPLVETSATLWSGFNEQSKYLTNNNFSPPSNLGWRENFNSIRLKNNYEIVGVDHPESFRVKAGFLINVALKIGDPNIEDLEIHVRGFSKKYATEFDEFHSISAGMYGSKKLVKGQTVIDYSFVRVKRDVKVGIYDLYYGIKNRKTEEYIKAVGGERFAKIGMIYVLSEGISLKASGVDWDGSLKKKLKDQFDEDFENIPEIRMLKRIRKLLLKKEVTKIDFSFDSISQYLNGFDKRILTFLSIRQQGVGRIRWGSSRGSFKEEIARNIEKITSNSDFHRYSIDNKKVCAIVVEVIVSETIVDYDDVNTDLFRSGIKFDYNNEIDYLLPTECTENKLSNDVERIKFILLKRKIINAEINVLHWLESHRGAITYYRTQSIVFDEPEHGL